MMETNSLQISIWFSEHIYVQIFIISFTSSINRFYNLVIQTVMRLNYYKLNQAHLDLKKVVYIAVLLVLPNIVVIQT